MPPPDDDHPQDALCEEAEAIGRMMLELSEAMRRYQAQSMGRFHLTVPQYIVLNTIRRRGRGCTMSELAEVAYQVPATMTGIIDRLSERGLVQRQQDPADRRAWRVALTPAGERLLDEVERFRQGSWRRVLAGLAPQERIALRRLLEYCLAAVLAELEHT
mgnify:CR=1 FL=1